MYTKSITHNHQIHYWMLSWTKGEREVCSIDTNNCMQPEFLGMVEFHQSDTDSSPHPIIHYHPESHTNYRLHNITSDPVPTAKALTHPLCPSPKIRTTDNSRTQHIPQEDDWRYYKYLYHTTLAWLGLLQCPHTVNHHMSKLVSDHRSCR